MEIIKIHYKISKPVENYEEIKEDAEQMKFLIDNGPFKGHYDKAFAVAHCQVSEKPYSFFVMGSEYRLMFADRVVINPEILENDQKPVRCREACLSFPFRAEKAVERYNLIKVRYQIFKDGKLETIEKLIEGIISQIFQHETDHTQGKNIYFQTEVPSKWWDN